MANEVSRCVPIADIIVMPGHNPRGTGPLPKIDELANSLHQSGQLQPILVSPASNDQESHRYVLIAGERRYEAAKKLGWDTVEVKVLNCSELDRAIMALTENSQRATMDPYAEAEVYATIMDRFHLSQAELATRLGRSEPHVSQRLKLLRDSISDLREAVQKGKITPTLARELSALPGEQQREYLKAVFEKKNARGPEGKVTIAEIKPSIDQSKRHIKHQKDPESAAKSEAGLQERIDAVRKKARLRAKEDILEAHSLYLHKGHRAKNETSVLKVKQTVETLEFVLGLRDSL
jgi:ParB family chromosome partitioning protein